MACKTLLIFVTLSIASLLSTPVYARPCGDGRPDYNGCDTYGYRCKNGRVIGTCTKTTGVQPEFRTKFQQDASTKASDIVTNSNQRTRCPSFCEGTILREGHWLHGHGDPECAYTSIFNASECASQAAIFEEFSAQVLANHRFQSDDGFYAIEFDDASTGAVEITVGNTTESVRYLVDGQEIAFIGSTFAITRLIWLIGSDALSISSGDLRATLQRVD